MTLHRGKISTRKIEILAIRELSREDLGCLREKRDAPAIAKLRDPHHALARFIASGLKINEAAERSGFSAARAYVLSIDPTFQDLVTFYRGQVNDAWLAAQDDFQRMAVGNMLKAERQLAEKLDKADEEGELLPTRDLIAIARDAADRFGYGKKSTNVNVNVDFAAKLEAARARSATARDVTPKQIETTVVEGNTLRRL